MSIQFFADYRPDLYGVECLLDTREPNQEGERRRCYIELFLRIAPHLTHGAELVYTEEKRDSSCIALRLVMKVPQTRTELDIPSSFLRD